MGDEVCAIVLAKVFAMMGVSVMLYDGPEDAAHDVQQGFDAASQNVPAQTRGVVWIVDERWRETTATIGV